MSLLSKITNPDFKSQFTLVKNPSSNGVNDLLINNTITVTVCINFMIFRDTDKTFELQVDLLKKKLTTTIMLILLIYQTKSLYEFPKEVYFDQKHQVINVPEINQS